jgi:hypothetical protein
LVIIDICCIFAVETRTIIDNIISRIMKAEVGKYKFGRHRNNWGIWQYDYVSETGSSARFIKDVFSYEEAVREVYRLNGWGEPKQIRRSY